MSGISDKTINYVNIPRNSKKFLPVYSASKSPFLRNSQTFQHLLRTPQVRFLSIPGNFKLRILCKVQFPRTPRNSKLMQLCLICVVWNFWKYLRIPRNSQKAGNSFCKGGFFSMKRLGVFLLPPGWDASPSHCSCDIFIAAVQIAYEHAHL